MMKQLVRATGWVMAVLFAGDAHAITRALSTAATGLNAQASNIERISNDLANVNTDGYKRGEQEFHDLMYQTVKPAGGQLGSGSITPVGIQIGMGVKVGAVHKVFEQGPARMTYHPFDLMIEGKGFFPVQMPNTGEIAYTRTGTFKLDPQGRVVLTNGAQLVPQITVPTNTINVVIAANGEVKAIMPDHSETILGQVQLVMFPNEQGLSAQGAGLYMPTMASGAPQQGIPGEGPFGGLLQGAREGSNVDVAKSMVDMITTQRAYEMNTKVMGVADQMLGATTQVK